MLTNLCLYLKIIFKFIILKVKCPHLSLTSKAVALNNIIDNGNGNSIVIMGGHV